jgi:PhnB protein
MRVTAHIVVPDAATAAEWYGRAFGAAERSRVPLPGDRVMTIELAFGDDVVHVASEFPEAGVLSPLTIGGSATVLQLQADDAPTPCGRKPWRQARSRAMSWPTSSGANATAS